MKKFLAVLLAVCMVVSMLTVAVVSVGAADSTGTKTITVGVIKYLMDEMSTGYQVHYWGGADDAKDADLTPTGTTEMKSVGNAYWNGDEQQFTMFTATVPADFTGYKVHNGGRWFGDDGTKDKTTVYIFNYSGGKALYEESVEPATEEPSQSATDAPAAEKAYYLVGTMNSWTAEDAFKLSKNEASTENEEYLLSGVALTTADEFKIVCTDGNEATAVWYPEPGDNYSGIKKDSTYTVYFRPNGDGYEDWYLGIINVIDEVVETAPVTDAPTQPATDKPTEPATDAPATKEPTQPVTDAPAAEKAFYLVGTMNEWTASDAYKLSRNIASTENEEYLLSGVALTTMDEFKIVCTDGNEATAVWYPDPGDNYSGIKKDSTYTVYFRPNGDGYEDWYLGIINVIDEVVETVPVTDAPTQPATKEPTQPVTDAPAAEKAFYLVGTMNEWTTSDAYKLSRNIASTENEEYLLSGVALTTADEFKIVCTDGNEATAVWYPDPGDNYSGIKKDSTYTVYFRPNGDGYEDWYLGIINVIDEVVETAPATDAPTQPATDVTEIPLDGSFNLVGTIDGTDYYGTDYTFENGTVTLDTTATSYVFVKQGETSYMTNGFDPEATEVTLYNTDITQLKSDKLMVPAGKATLTLKAYSDGTFKLSYVLDEAYTEPVTDATATDPAEKAFYLVGTMNEWTASDAYKLSRNIASTENEEYLLSGVALTTKDEFKIVCTDGNEATAVWYPDPGDNYSGIKKDSTYTVYFRPNGDGYEDWYMGIINVIDEVVETTPVTDEPTVPTVPTDPTPSEPAEKAYYLVGTMNNWTAENAFKLSKNEASTENEEYLLSGVALTTKDEFKIVCTDGNEATAVWYPDPGDNYSGIKKDSTYTVYFRPNGDGYEDWYLGIINVIDEVVETVPVTDEPTVPTVPTDPTPSEPAEKAYYLVGTMNNWTAEDAFKLSKNEASTENEEYLLSGVALTTKDEFKIVCTDGNEATAIWYPDPGDNYSGIKKDSTYTVYFRPNGDGYEDWYMGIINVIDEVTETQPATDEPTQPATDVTEIPLDGSFNLVGTIDGTDYYGTDYTFTEGKLTLDTTNASYVFVKQGETSYMTNSFDPEATEVTLYNTDITQLKSDKLMVPAGKATLTLKAYSDGTFKLSYVLDEAYTEPASDVPGEKAYYLVGTMNEWTAEDAFKLSKNIASTENEEYLISGVALTTKDEFKIVCTDGDPATAVWYPIGGDNYSGIAKDSIYTVYFRPNADGFEDWYMGTIIAIDEVTETQPVTDEPSQPVTDEPAEKAYYLVGTMNEWTASDAYKLSRNIASTENEEYLISGVALTTTDEFKIVCTDGNEATAVWYPDPGDNYSGIKKDSTYTVYFRPNGDGYEDWYMGIINVIDEVTETQPATDEPTQPASDVPGEKAFYLVGTMNEWTANDAYKLSRNIASTENEEYLISGVALTTKDEFKIVCTDGNEATAVWYPDPGDNYSGIKKDSTYTVYFRPNGDGYEDWYMGIINAIDEVTETQPVTEEPSQPATDVPGEMAYYLVGTMNSWTAEEGYKLSRNIASTENEEYLISGVTLTTTDEFKIVGTDGNEATAVWFPKEQGNYTGIEKDGTYTVYFRPNGDGYEDWYCGVINVIAEETPSDPTPSDPTPSDPVVESGYYVVGTMTEWKLDEAYKLAKNEAAAETEEYVYENLDLTPDSEFKVVYTGDGKLEGATWYPDLVDNYGANGEITEKGTYTVYFRPNYDGYDDWFYGCIAVINNSEPQLQLGDVNMDGKVDIQDATLLQSCLAEMTTLTDEQLKLADVDQDGFVNVRDVTAIQRIVAEMSLTFH